MISKIELDDCVYCETKPSVKFILTETVYGYYIDCILDCECVGLVQRESHLTLKEFKEKIREWWDIRNEKNQ